MDREITCLWKKSNVGTIPMESHQENHLFLLIVFCARDMIFCTFLELLLWISIILPWGKTNNLWWSNFWFGFQVFEDVHLDSRPTLKKVLNYLNIVFAVVFSVEFLLKTLGLGFLTYFKNAWNCLDVIIVAVSKEHLKQ